SDLDPSAPSALIVFTDVHQAPGIEVGQDLYRLVAQQGDGGIDELKEVMRKDSGAQTHGDALHPLGQQDGKFGREGHRFAFPPVVGELPGGSLRIEEDLQGEFSQPGLNITGGGSTVTGAGISPITLGVN